MATTNLDAIALPRSPLHAPRSTLYAILAPVRLPPTLSRLALGLLYIAAGANHFWHTAFYVSIMPPYLPWHLLLVLISGAAEIGLGALVLVPRWSRLAAWGLIALLIAVFPANLHMALHTGQHTQTLKKRDPDFRLQLLADAEGAVRRCHNSIPCACPRLDAHALRLGVTFIFRDTERDVTGFGVPVERDQRESERCRFRNANRAVPRAEHRDLILVTNAELIISAARFLEVREHRRRQLGKVMLHQAQQPWAGMRCAGKHHLVLAMKQRAAAAVCWLVIVAGHTGRHIVRPPRPRGDTYVRLSPRWLCPRVARKPGSHHTAA